MNNEWQPIDTAPKDGTRILAWIPELQDPIRIAHYYQTEHRKFGEVVSRSEGWRGDTPLFALRHIPTHWMPLPSDLPPANRGFGQ